MAACQRCREAIGGHRLANMRLNAGQRPGFFLFNRQGFFYLIGKKEIPGGEDRLKETKLAGLWPGGSQASLVRYGMLNCHSGVCELVLEQ